MEWKELFDMQAKLDEYIEKTHQIKKEEVFDKKILALLVEVGELANETRCFKFWSKKEPSKRATILEEYVDGIHFLMSLGLEKAYFFNEEALSERREDLTEQFNQVFAAVVSFRSDSSENNYKHMFSTYLKLGDVLGFDSKEVQKAYMDKNQTNYQRQDNGY